MLLSYQVLWKITSTVQRSITLAPSVLLQYASDTILARFVQIIVFVVILRNRLARCLGTVLCGGAADALDVGIKQRFLLDKRFGDFFKKLGDYRSTKGSELTDEEQGLIADRINSVVNLKSHTLPVFDIKSTAEEEDVSEIFVRVNSGGVSLKQNDFILTLLSLYWDDGRREIEQFSKDSTAPAKGKTTSYNQLTTVSAQDVIRVVMAYAFDRARLKYGYKLLRGADFDKKGAVDDNLRVQRFNTLKEKLPDVLDVQLA